MPHVGFFVDGEICQRARLGDAVKAFQAREIFCVAISGTCAS